MDPNFWSFPVLSPRCGLSLLIVDQTATITATETPTLPFIGSMIIAVYVQLLHLAIGIVTLVSGKPDPLAVGSYWPSYQSFKLSFSDVLIDKDIG